MPEEVKVGYDYEGKYIRDIVRQIRGGEVYVKVPNEKKFKLVQYLFNELERVLEFCYRKNEDGTYLVWTE